MYLAFLLSLLYVGIESGISSWAAQYAVAEFGFEARAASFTVSLFWAGLLVGRVAIPLLARRVPLPLQLVVLGAGQALSVLLLALLRSPAWLYPLVLLSGLSFSSFFPLTMTIVGQRLRENQTVGLGLVSTGGGVGQFGFPFAMALIADRFGLRSGFLFFAALGLLLVAGCLGVLRETARR